MNPLLPIALIASSVLLYQIGQKSLPNNINHWHALIIYYSLALLIVMGITFFDRPEKTFLQSIQNINWAVILVTLSIVGIELGWILAFRAGSSLGITGIIVNAIVAVLVIPIGIWFFKEKFSIVNFIGLIFCVVGLVLITKK